MSGESVQANFRPEPDRELVELARYVKEYRVESQEIYEIARLCLLDTLGCAVLAAGLPDCARLLGPVIPGTYVLDGARVPGTRYQLDPVAAAFNIGSAIRWLDFNDAWLAADWGHPSDNLGGILAVADHLSRRESAKGKEALTMRDVLTAMIKAHEIQGCLALENSFRESGLGHVALVKVATAAVVTDLLGGSQDQVMAAVSQAWADGQSLQLYRQAPDTGSGKSWGGGDATSRGVFLALLTMRGEAGYRGVLSAPRWCFQQLSIGGRPLSLQRPYGSGHMEKVLGEALPHPEEKLARNLGTLISRERVAKIISLSRDRERFESMAAHHFMALFTV